MIDSHQEEVFVEGARSFPIKLIGAGAALLITALVFTGYTLLRKRHSENAPSTVPVAEVRQHPKVLVMVDEALMQGGKTILGGTVKNTSTEKIDGLSVELELKRRNDASVETQLLALQPAQLEPQQEGRYSLQLKAQDYSSAKLIGLKTASGVVPYATAPGLKRPPERLESKTIVIGKPSSKSGEFLNSPDNPARVP